jgi:hypothetical protein
LSAESDVRIGVDASPIQQLISVLGELNTELNASGQSAATFMSENEGVASVLEQTTSAASGLASPLGNLVSETSAAGSGMTSLAESTSTLDSSFASGQGEVTGFGEQVSSLGGIFSAAGTEEQTFSGGLANLNEKAQAATGGLDEANTATQQMGTSQSKTSTETVGLGTKIGLLGGFIGSTTSSVFGLVEGYTSMEKAGVAAAKAHASLITAENSVMKTQDALNTAIAKYGPNSRQATEAALAHQKAEETLGVAQDRASLAQEHATEAQIGYAIQVVETVSNIVMMGSTLAALRGEMGLTSAAQVEGAGASAVAGGAMEGEAAAAATAAGATGSLGLAMLAVAAPIVGAIALFALIETNTFGMGDAFRSTTIVIANAIDNIVNNVHALWNGFVEFLNNLSRFSADVNNAMISTENAFITAFNGIITATQNFVNNFRSGLIGLANFFINDVINPAIGAWNSFLFGLESTGGATVAKVVGFFNDLGVKIVGAMLTLVGGLNSAFSAIGITTFKPAVDALTKFQTDLKNTGTAASQSASQSKEAWAGGIPTLVPISNDLGKVTLGTVGVAKGFVDVTKAGHTWDTLLQSTDTHMAASIAQTVNYYSHWENVAKVLQGQVSPAIQNVIKWVYEHVAGAKEQIAALLGTQQAAAAASGGMDKHAGAQKADDAATKELDAALAKIQGTVGDTSAAFADQVKSLHLTSAEYTLLDSALDTIVGKEQKANAQTAEQKRVFGELYPVFGKDIEAIDKTSLANAQLAAKMGNTAQQAHTLITAMTDATNKMNDDTIASNATAAANIQLAGSDTQLANVQANYNKTLSETNLSLHALVFGLTDAAAANTRLTNATLQGDVQFAKFVTDTQNGIATQAEYSKQLEASTGWFKQMPGFIEPTIKNLELLQKAEMGDADAAKQLADESRKAWSDLVSASDDLMKKLFDVWDKGGKHTAKGFKDAFKSLPKDIQAYLSPSDKLALETTAKYGEIANHAGILFATELRAHQGEPADIMDAAARGAVKAYLDAATAGDPQMAAAFKPVFDALATGSDAAVKAALDNIAKMPGPVGDMARQMQTSMNGAATGVTSVGTAATGAAGPIGDLNTQARQLVVVTLDFNTLARTMVQTTADFSTLARTIVTVTIDFNNIARSIVQTTTDMSNLARAITQSTTDINNWARATTQETSNMNTLARAVSQTTSDLNTAARAINQTASNLGTLSSAASKGSSALSSLARTIVNVGNDANNAKSQVQSLANAINSLHDKTIHVTLVRTITGPTLGQGGLSPAAGGAISAAATPTTATTTPTTSNVTVVQPVRSAAATGAGGGGGATIAGQKTLQPLVIITQLDKRQLARELRTIIFEDSSQF